MVGQIKVKKMVNYQCDWFEFSIAKISLDEIPLTIMHGGTSTFTLYATRNCTHSWKLQ